MARLELPLRRRQKALALSVRLYSLFLYIYPVSFRRTYATRMVQVFDDSCRALLQKQGIPALFPLWLRTLSDLAHSACLERWQGLQEGFRSMIKTRSMPPRLWIALAATIIAFAVSLIASLNLYLLEDGNALTQAAYSASSLLRFSYDGIYLSALAAGVAMCAILAYAVIARTILVIGGLIIVELIVALGGFGGLLVRHPLTFLVFFGVFLVLTLLSLGLGRALAKRVTRFLGTRPAAMLGACVSVSSLLLINVGALVLHTLLLNPVNHALYMQGQIQGTHFNFSLIAMGIASLTLFVCLISLGFAFRLPSHPRPV